MYRRAYETLPQLPADRSLHDIEGSKAAMRLIVDLYRPRSVGWETEPLEPGDMLVVGPPGGGPGHAMVAGPARQLWHCMPAGVVRTGLQLKQTDWTLFRVYRVADKHTWA